LRLGAAVCTESLYFEQGDAALLIRADDANQKAISIQMKLLLPMSRRSGGKIGTKMARDHRWNTATYNCKNLELQRRCAPNF
jgi:hypothetical protein